MTERSAPDLASSLGDSLSLDAFHERVLRRLAPQAEAIRDQVRLVETEFPNLKQQIIARAEEAFRGLLILPGTNAKPFFVGDPPRWHDNPVHDYEYVFCLNRMDHWRTLLRAFSLTQDSRYAQKVVDELRDWIVTCPRPSLEPWENFRGAQPWRVLEAGIRMFHSWRLVLPHLLGSNLLNPGLLAEFAGSVLEHGEALLHVAPQVYPNADHNHYLMTSLGLLTAATMFPEFAAAETWKRHAVTELERCAVVQLSPEGGQIEGCPHYHNECMGWFAQALFLARENQVSVPATFLARMENAIHYTLWSLRPCGSAVPWGDSDADREIAISSALLGYRLFRDPDFLRIVTRLCDVEEVRACCIHDLWDHPDTHELLAAIDQASASSATISLPLDSWQKSLDQVMLRSGWSRDALSLFFACRTPINNAHAHLDPMGFDFTAHGRALLVDPGRFCYREDDDRRIFKSATSHNTVLVNGREPFEYLHSWGYGPQRPGFVLDVSTDGDIEMALARHDNYESVIHHRAVALIGNAALLVLDWFDHLTTVDFLHFYFHFDSTGVVWEAAQNRARTQDPDQANVILAVSPGLDGELLPGRISDFLDQSRPSIRLRLTASATGATTRVFATVIVPRPAASPLPEFIGPKVESSSNGHRMAFSLGGQAYDVSWNDSSKLPEIRPR